MCRNSCITLGTLLANKMSVLSGGIDFLGTTLNSKVTWTGGSLSNFSNALVSNLSFSLIFNIIW